jgi:hypothetical protein
MTRQESFKRRVRERMARTGERYVAARRALIEKADARDADAAPDGRRWVSEPEQSDEVVREATGRGWDEWCDVIDAFPGRGDGHAAIATHVQQEHDVEGWWAQTVTVGYERIVGLRLPHQGLDGTFTAGRSATIRVDSAALRETLLDEDGRAALFSGIETELRSRPTSKNVRLRVGSGTAEIAIDQRDDGRAKVTIAHAKLPEATDVELWKSFWGDWLAALDEDG